MILQFAKLEKEAVTPVRKHPHDAGVDVYSLHDATVMPFSARIIRTGVTFDIPEGYMLEARPKGRHDHLIGAGIIDAGYQGEILIKVVNYKLDFLRIHKGDPVAQLILVKIETPEVEEIFEKNLHSKISDRGKTGGIVIQNQNMTK